jgi:hypothetical protein
MKFKNFPKIYEIVAKKFLNDKNFPCDEVHIKTYSNGRCVIDTYYQKLFQDSIVSCRSNLLEQESHEYCVIVDTNDQLHYFVDNIEIIDEAVLKEKLEFLRSLFFQKTVTHHLDGLEEQDINRIVVTSQLREFVDKYLGAVINSLEG